MSCFYEISHNQWETKGFAWAMGYGPLPEMPFLHPTFLERERIFWEINPMPPGLEIDSRGSKWPDVLGCGGGPPSEFFSGKIIQSLQNAGIQLGRITPMPIGEIRCKKLREIPAPDYFVVEIIPGIEVDLVATGFKLDAAGKAIVHPPPKPFPSPYRYRASTWNGSDLFAYRHFGPTDGPYTEMLCTERVKELAEREGWTNVRFQPTTAV